MLTAPVVVTIDGRMQSTIVAGLIEHGVVLGSLRDILVNVTDEVHRDPDGSIVLIRGSRRICVHLGSRRAEVAGRALTLPVAPQRLGDDVRLPIAAVSEALGARVIFHSQTHTLAILTPVDQSPIATPTPQALHLVSDPTSITPVVIFTPQVVETPEPPVTFPSTPRRTPIPVRPDLPQPM